MRTCALAAIASAALAFIGQLPLQRELFESVPMQSSPVDALQRRYSSHVESRLLYIPSLWNYRLQMLMMVPSC